MLTKKRRQHHVWQHYLRSWTDGRDLYTLFRSNGRIIRTGTGSVANQRDFYRLREMTPFHRAIVEEFIRKSGPDPEIHAPTVKMFTSLFELKRRLDASGTSNPEVERIWDIAINNLEEEIHAAIEAMAIPILELLKNGDFSFVERDKTYTQLTWFLGVQLTRTTRMTNAFATFPDGDLEPVAGVFRHIIGLNMGFSLFTHRRASRVSLLSAPHGFTFVTGDCPVVNARKLTGSADPEKLILYYPVTPSRALLIDMNHSDPGTALEEAPPEQVLRYNELMAEMAVDQVFASNEEELCRLRDILASA